MQIGTDILSNSDYLDLLGIDEIVHILEGPDNENMNFNEEQKLIKLRNQHLMVRKNVYKLF